MYVIARRISGIGFSNVGYKARYADTGLHLMVVYYYFDVYSETDGKEIRRAEVQVETVPWYIS